MSFLVKKLIKEYEFLHFNEMEKMKNEEKQFFKKLFVWIIIGAISIVMSKVELFDYGYYRDIITTTVLILSIVCLFMITKLFINFLSYSNKYHKNYRLRHYRYYDDFLSLLESVFKKQVINSLDEIIELIDNEIDSDYKLNIFKQGINIVVSGYLIKLILDYISKLGIYYIYLTIIIYISFLLIALGVNKIQNPSTSNGKRRNLYYLRNDLYELKIMKEHLTTNKDYRTDKGRKIKKK